MFTQSAAFYDKLYAARGKDYRLEAEALARYIRDVVPGARTLLDVGCGTGAHLAEFARLGFACRGIDADFKMVALARARCPDIDIEPGDMLALALPERFDAVVALFGTIAYARTEELLQNTIACLAAHLGEGGVLLVEPFLTFSEFTPGHVDGVFVDEPELKIARMSVSKQLGHLAILDFHYLVASKTGIERLFERHELGLFDEAAYRTAFDAAGLTFETPNLPEIAFGRALYAGRRR